MGLGRNALIYGSDGLPTGNATVPEPYAVTPGAQILVDAVVTGLNGDTLVFNDGVIPNPEFWAYISPDAPIQPPQAFVDVMSDEAFWDGMDSAFVFNFADYGITSIDTTHPFFFVLLFYSLINGGSQSFGGTNTLSTANVDAILAVVANSGLIALLNLYGPSMGEPTGGAANADIATIVTNGGMVIVNIGGVQTTFP